MNNIIIVTRNMKAGGAERVISQLANYFIKKDIECTIITLDNEEIFYKLNDDVDIISIGKKSKNNYLDKLIRYINLRRIIKEKPPNIVLVMPEEIGIFVIPALLGTGIPVVVSERNNPWVMPWKKATRLCRILFYPFASGFIFQTKQAESFFPEFIRKKSVILSNPLEIDRIPEPWNGKRRKEIVGVGRLDKQKNFSLLIKAFAKFYKNHPDYVLIIYGEGRLREELEKLAASLLPPMTYSFPGKSDNLLEEINGAEMFVLSSDYEGMPNVVIEAMAMGMPVISTDCPSGGSAELIENGISGILVPVGDIDEMCNAMSQFADSAELRNLLGNNAQKIKKRLDSKIVAEQWRVYLDAVSKEKNTD